MYAHVKRAFMQSTLEHCGDSSLSAIPEAELLIECLRESPLSVSAQRDIDWPALLTLSETHTVLPLVYRALAASGAEIPQSFLGAILDSQRSSERLAAELEFLLAVFAQHHIEVIPLKGPVLAELLYGDVTMRPCTDLDLLVRVDDFDRAEKLLMDAGCVASAPADDYQRKFVRNGILVELHYGVASPRTFPFDLNGAWKRAQNATFHGHPLKVISEADRCLYLMLHGLKHGYGKLIWILDAALALKALAERNPRELVEQARAQGLEKVFYIGCAMVREVFPQHLPESLVAALAESPEAMRGAHAFVEALLTGEASTGRDPDIWGLYLQTETDPVKRWGRRLMFFIPTNEDYRWAMHHRIPRRLAPLLRPFRLLAKHGFSQAWKTAFPRSN
jgi:hypothetical protein